MSKLIKYAKDVEHYGYGSHKRIFHVKESKAKHKEDKTPKKINSDEDVVAVKLPKSGTAFSVKNPKAKQKLCPAMTSKGNLPEHDLTDEKKQKKDHLPGYMSTMQ
jgi:hypothetical protein